MKKIYVFLIFLSGFAQAQIINFPDPAFKAMLLTSAPNVNVAYNPDGVSFKIDADNDGEISVAEAQAVYQLYVDSAGISDLTGIENFNNVWFLTCIQNNITSLDVSMMSNLTNLYCMTNSLSNLVVNDALEVLRAENNLLTSLDLSSHIAPFTNVLLDNNLLNSLTIGSTYFLRVSNNPITSLNVTGEFNTLQANFTPLTTLDLSNAHMTENGMLLFNDTPLQLLITKNGYDETNSFSLTENFNGLVPNLYICADLDEIAGFEAQIESATVDNWFIGSYCSFTPGGNYNTITGTFQFDANGDGCDAADTNFPAYVRVDITDVTDGIDNNTTFSNTSGNYTAYAGVGNYLIHPVFPNPYFTISPEFASADFLFDNSVITNNFCISANGVHPDLALVLTGQAPRPGFDVRYKVVYTNQGNTTESGIVNLTFDDLRMDFVSAIPAVDTQALNNLAWNFTNLQPFESRAVEFYLHVNAPTDTPAVNAGDMLPFTATITQPVAEETPLDNTFAVTQIATNAYDPNNKSCLEGETLTPANIGQYLHYNINFENTGNANATNVVVKDVIDITKYDIDSFELIYASHPVRAKITGNVIEFIFENINLPPSGTNPIGGHGNVLFAIKTLPGLQEGDVVANTANIYFDYNHPIDTNEARTTFALLNTKDFNADSSISVYPNPTKNHIHVSAKNNLRTIAIFDIQGRLLQSVTENEMSATIDISNRQAGVYFVKITTEKGTAVEKIIKE